jgi:prevent-host-death family protein
MIARSEAEAQAALDEILDSIDVEPVAITRDGVPVAYFISARDMDLLKSTRRENPPKACAD